MLNVTSPTPDGVYAPGDSIDVVVEFSEFVAVSGTPFVNLETGLIDRTAMYVSGSGTRFLRFRYDIQPGDISYDLDFVDAHSLERGFDITGAVGTILMMSSNPAVAADIDLPLVGAAGSLSYNSALIVDGATPYITGLDFDAADGSSFTLGDRVTVVVRFSAAVSVVGALRIKMETGSIDRYAVYVNGTNTTVLRFEYVVETATSRTCSTTTRMRPSSARQPRRSTSRKAP